ncbi:hypothetical protein TRVL_05551 [Trypanosoma vivax]|nr:hypothetical protein TRVL_05551 [Trypanosoma vivax]
MVSTFCMGGEMDKKSRKTWGEQGVGGKARRKNGTLLYHFRKVRTSEKRKRVQEGMAAQADMSVRTREWGQGRKRGSIEADEEHGGHTHVSGKTSGGELDTNSLALSKGMCARQRGRLRRHCLHGTIMEGRDAGAGQQEKVMKTKKREVLVAGEGWRSAGVARARKATLVELRGVNRNG